MKESYLDKIKSKYKSRPLDFGGKEFSFVLTSDEKYDEPFAPFNKGEVSLIPTGQNLESHVLHNIKFLKIDYVNDKIAIFYLNM